MKDAILNTEFGPIEISMDGGGFRMLETFLRIPESEDGGASATLVVEVPSVKDDPGESEISSRRRFWAVDSDKAADISKLFAFASQLVGLLNEANSEAISAAEQHEAEEEQRRRETEEARQKVLDEREETMLQELVDERVKVRHKGYKTMCYGTVYVQPLYGEPQRTYKIEDDEEPSGYRARLRYSDQGDTRDNGMDSYARLDAKTEKGWRTVWDDGKDDLPDYDRDVKLPKARPWND